MCEHTHTHKCVRRCAQAVTNTVLAINWNYDWKRTGPLRYHKVWTLQQVYCGYPNSNSFHFFRFYIHMNPAVPSATALRYLAKEKAKAPAVITTEPLKGIRMHIDNTGPWAITGLIFMPDKQSASLWAFSWHLTAALPTESSVLMQKMKWLRGLLNISGLFNHNFLS